MGVKLRKLLCILTSMLIVISCLLPAVSVQAYTDDETISKYINDGGKATGVGVAAWMVAMYRIGVPYVWGGLSVSGADCSGTIYMYRNAGINRGAMRTEAQETGYVANGIPRIHGLGLIVIGAHVGLYFGCDVTATKNNGGSGWYTGEAKTGDMTHNLSPTEGMALQPHESYHNNCWDIWIKLGGVEYPDTGWVNFLGQPFYYENGQYVVSCTKTINGVTYKFDKDGIPDKKPKDSEYIQSATLKFGSEVKVSGNAMEQSDINTQLNDTSETSSITNETRGTETSQQPFTEVSRETLERELTFEEQQRIEEINHDRELQQELNRWSALYTISAFVGILLIVYSMLLVVSFYFDVMNVFTDMSLLSLLTFGAMYPIGSNENMLLVQRGKGDKRHYVSHTGIWLSFGIGVISASILIYMKSVIMTLIQISNYINNLF